MYKVDRTTKKTTSLKTMSFKDAGLKEVNDLQEWIVENPSMLGEELLIIQKEFAGFSDTRERLDLLALDKNKRLVVIENKIDDSGRDVTWQAMKYASYTSTMTKERIIDVFDEYIKKNMIEGNATELIASFYNESIEDIVLNDGFSQRIILVAGSFRKEVTSTVLWLSNMNVDITCCKVNMFSYNDEMFIDIDRIIPLKEASEYTIQVKEKNLSNNIVKTELAKNQNMRFNFWTRFITEMNRKSSLFKNISPTKDSWIQASSGVSNIYYVVSMTKNEARLELYLRHNESDMNNELLRRIKKSVPINEYYKRLEWFEYDSHKISKVTISYPCNYYDNDSWTEITQKLTDGLVVFAKYFETAITNLMN